jgi:hypothetical protein
VWKLFYRNLKKERLIGCGAYTYVRRNYKNKTMKFKTIFYLLIISTTIFSSPKVDSTIYIRIKAIEKNIVTQEELKEKIVSIKERIENEERINEKTLDGISKQLDAASYNLSVFGILFGIGAICLGIYVTYVERKIVKISEENKELLLKNKTIKNEVEALNNLIQKDIFGLYLKIKREETIYILDRLIKVPKDIANVCSELLSRELQQEDFDKLIQAYGKLKIQNNKDTGEEDSNLHYSEQYKVVFFQHFLNQSMRNSDLRKDMLDYLYFGIHSAFENDIIKSTTDFTTAIIDLGIVNFEQEINKYFEGLSSSEHKNYIDVYKALFNTLQSRKNRFDFMSVIKSVEATRKAKINFGQLLIDSYSKDNPTETENLIFSEIKRLSEEESLSEEAIKIQIESIKKAEAERKAQVEERAKKIEEAKKK